jgi:integrase
MDNSVAAAIAPAIVNRTLLRKPNVELRTREHLTADEAERLIVTASANRQGHRDALMVLLAFRHGLRAGELVDLRWEQIDFATATLHVRRTKNGTPATHPLTGREMRALRKHQREAARSAFVFVSERGAPLSAPGFSRMVERAGRSAKLGIKVHAHMLRHACGYALANAGHDTRALQGLSLPKIRSLWIRSMSQNHRIIRADVCDPARAVDLRCRHFQVATQAASREPVSSPSA